MARLKHAVTGVVVNVSDEKAATLDGYAPVDEEKAAAKPAARRAKTADDK